MSGQEPEPATRRVPTSETERPSSTTAGTPAPGSTPTGEDSGLHVDRFWSTRRVPATIVALFAVAGTGLLLYDVAAVRAGQSAMRWRRKLAHELATRPLDDFWMIVGAALAMAVGLWLMVLAVTPGLRGLLPMRPPPVRKPPTCTRGSTAPLPRSCCETGPWKWRASSRPGSTWAVARSGQG